MNAVIKTEGLTKSYGRQTAVDSLDLTVHEGEIFGYLGPNGAGKTTTLLMLLGLTEPTSGKAEVLGFDPVREPLKVKALVGYLPENVGFYNDLTARENLMYITRLNDIPDDEAGGRITEVLAKVGLGEEEEKPIAAYSRGMRQRLGVAELLVKKPRLIFLDEPTLGLDPDGISRMLDLIVSLAQEQKMSILVSSHNLHQVQRICSRVGIMRKGQMVAQGTLEELAQALGQTDTKASLEAIYMRYFKEG
jgi:ABC-2 type transport system ATP-binding protein